MPSHVDWRVRCVWVRFTSRRHAEHGADLPHSNAARPMCELLRRVELPAHLRHTGTTGTTTTTTTTLGVNARCDPLTDACDSSSNLVFAAPPLQGVPSARSRARVQGPRWWYLQFCWPLHARYTCGKHPDTSQKLQQHHAEQDLGDGGGRRQTVEMIPNPLARRRPRLAEPASTDMQTHGLQPKDTC